MLFTKPVGICRLEEYLSYKNWKWQLDGLYFIKYMKLHLSHQLCKVDELQSIPILQIVCLLLVCGMKWGGGGRRLEIGSTWDFFKGKILPLYTPCFFSPWASFGKHACLIPKFILKIRAFKSNLDVGVWKSTLSKGITGKQMGVFKQWTCTLLLGACLKSYGTAWQKTSRLSAYFIN